MEEQKENVENVENVEMTQENEIRDNSPVVETLENTDEAIRENPEAKTAEVRESPEVAVEVAQAAELPSEESYTLSTDEKVSIDDEAAREIELAETIARYENYDLSQINDEARLLLQNEDIAFLKTAFSKLKSIQEDKYLTLSGNFVSTTPAEGEEAVEPSEEQIKLQRLNEEFQIYAREYSKKRKEFKELQEKELEDNYNKKVELLDALKKLIESNEPLKKMFDEFNSIKEHWKKIGNVPKTKNNDLWLNYNHYVELFLGKVSQEKELRELDYKKNLEIKLELCEKAESLLLEKSILNGFKQLQELHQQWKETGPVPVEHKDTIWERFHAASEKIKDMRMNYYSELSEKQNNNHEAKKAILEKMRMIATSEILSAQEWTERTNEVNELFKIWKTIGPAPKEVNDQIWNDFKGLVDAFYAGKNEFFGQLKQEYQENYNKKVNICIQAEALQNSNEWKKTSEQLKKLQEEWKSVGPVQKNASEALWKRFRKACDAFFHTKEQFFANIDTVEAENLAKKKEILAELDAYTFGDDKAANLEAIKDFQRRWFETGRVPIKEKDNINAEFKKKVDAVFEKLKLSRMATDQNNFKEHFEKISENANGQNEIVREIKFIQQKMAKLEENIRLWENNISFFNNSKNADLLLKEFVDKIEKSKVELRVLHEKQNYLRNLMNTK